MSEWSKCDQLCVGKRNRSAICYELNTGQTVQPNLASKYCTRSVKPMDEYERCNEDCVLEWDINKSECSEVCGDGWRQVQATCVQKIIRTGLYNKVDVGFCPQNTKPPALEKCMGNCNDAIWSYGEWEPVSHFKKCYFEML